MGTRKGSVGLLACAVATMMASCSADADSGEVDHQFNRDRCDSVDFVADLPEGIYPGPCSIQRFDADGAELKLEVWMYDEFGYPTSKRESEDGRANGWTETYYLPGLSATHDVDLDGDAIPDRRFQYVVDDNCITTGALVDEGAVGAYSGAITYHYDERDNLLGREFDYDGDGQLELETRIEYDTDGNPTRSEVYVGGSQEALAIVSYTYDSEGNLLREEKNEPVDAFVNERTEYGADGRLLREEKDEDGDGIMDVEVEYRHDEFGNTLAGEVSHAEDGSAAGEIVHKYDCWAGWTGR